MAQMRRALRVSAGIAVTAALMTGCSAATPEEEPVQQSEAAPEETAPEGSGGEELVASVEEGINNNFPGGISTGSPLYAVTEYEPMNDETLRAHVQESLTDGQRDETATHIFNMSGTDELRVVVIRDTSGTDSNHYR